jgi:uncharacterized membrane protein YgcG
MLLKYLPVLLVLAVWIYAFIDCLNTPENEVRKLPKVVWVIVILLFGQVLVGPVVWFAVGRPRRNAPYGATKPQERRWVAPDDNPDFLNSLHQRMQYGQEETRSEDDTRGGDKDSDGTGPSGDGSGNGSGGSGNRGNRGGSGNTDNNDPPSAGR